MTAQQKRPIGALYIYNVLRQNTKEEEDVCRVF